MGSGQRPRRKLRAAATVTSLGGGSATLNCDVGGSIGVWGVDPLPVAEPLTLVAQHESLVVVSQSGSQWQVHQTPLARDLYVCVEHGRLYRVTRKRAFEIEVRPA